MAQPMVNTLSPILNPQALQESPRLFPLSVLPCGSRWATFFLP